MSKNFRFKSTIIFFLVTVIFIGRNIDRIFYEVDFYQANFKQNMFFFTDKKHFRIDNKLKDLSKIYNDCKPNINNCSNNQDFIIKKAYGKMILIRKVGRNFFREHYATLQVWGAEFGHSL